MNSCWRVAWLHVWPAVALSAWWGLLWGLVHAAEIEWVSVEVTVVRYPPGVVNTSTADTGTSSQDDSRSPRLQA